MQNAESCQKKDTFSQKEKEAFESKNNNKRNLRAGWGQQAPTQSTTLVRWHQTNATIHTCKTPNFQKGSILQYA